MTLISWVAVVLVACALFVAIGLGVLFVRRFVLQREGGFDMCLRAGSVEGWAGGWVFGIGRYRGDDLEWFRTFSFAARPKRSIRRDDIDVVNRRQPDADEAYELPAGHIVLACADGEAEFEISMTAAAATAFLARLEAAPPGGHMVA